MAGKISRLLCSCSSKFIYSPQRSSLLLKTGEKESLLVKCFSTSSSASPIVNSHDNMTIANLDLSRLTLKDDQSNDKVNISNSISEHHRTLPFFLNSIQHRIPAPMGLPINYKNIIINPVIPPIPHGRNPLNPQPTPLEDPLSISNKITIDEAPDVNKIEKHAARLIVIRRIKMNRHKLKKLRKRMKHIWAKIKLRRRMRNERAYLNSKLAQIREAERFDAKEHVAMLIAKAKHKEIPRRWKGKRMPAWWIKEQIALGNITL